MFDADRFVADCRAALAVDPTHKGVREVVARAVADPAAVFRGLATPEHAHIGVLHRSPDLTVLNLVWGPGMAVPPHNHNMWAVIGIYGGAEDNIFWRRIKGERGIAAAGARSLRTGDVDTLGRDVIHSVLNPTARCTAALHVYGGDFFAAHRSEWEPESLREGRFDAEAARRRFGG
jgi:predicted metal-dependent enzyme (double-stranded beta helix superfamily)